MARIYLVRYFIIRPDVDTVIAAIFGSQFEEDNPDGYEEAKSEICRVTYNWKTRALNAFMESVAKQSVEMPLLRSEKRIPELRAHFNPPLTSPMPPSVSPLKQTTSTGASAQEKR